MRAPPLTPRRKPSQDRSGHTVAILIEAAAQVLEADGLEGFNTNAVARRAGVSIGSLYQYFPGKDALTVALMRRENARFHDESVAAFQSADGHEALTRYIAAAVHQQLARPRLARLLDIEEGRPEIQEAFRDTTTLRRHLELALKRPDLPTQPRPRVAAKDVAAIIRGLTDAAGERGETNLADLRRRITAAVFGYLAQMQQSAPVTKASSRGNARKTAA